MTDRMRLYELMPGEGFELVAPVDPSEWERFRRFDGTPQLQSWAPVPVTRVTEDEGRQRKTADFPWLGEHVLVMRRRATEVLAEILKDHGELLPLQCDDAELWVYNVRRVIDALDEPRSKVVRFPGTGRIMTVERYAFRSDQVNGHLLFKVRQLPRGPVFVTDTFVKLVRSQQLVGLDFKPVWEGPAQTH